MAFDAQFTNDNNQRTCTCKRWQSARIPYYAISAIDYYHDKLENNIDDCYKVFKFLGAYRHIYTLYKAWTIGLGMMKFL